MASHSGCRYISRVQPVSGDASVFVEFDPDHGGDGASMRVALVCRAGLSIAVRDRLGWTLFRCLGDHLSPEFGIA